MKEHETTEEGVLKPQQSPSIAVQPQEVQHLLRDRLATKLTEDELNSLISEVGVLWARKDGADRVKSSIDYIEYKCREIEKALRDTDRHVKREAREHKERVFRDRSPLRTNGLLMYGGLNPVTSTPVTNTPVTNTPVTNTPVTNTLTSITTTRADTTSRNSLLDSYFS